VTAGQVTAYSKRLDLFSPELRKAAKLPETAMISAHVCTRCLRTMSKV
jgi:ribosomal protein L28